MGDSDDEYDRKRRDKFRGERSTTEYRGGRREDRRDDRRDDWDRPDYRDYRRERYSPGRDLPPVKRMRGDWGDDRSRFVPHDPYGGGGYGGFGHEPFPYGSPYPAGPPLNQREPPPTGDMLTQPSMMTLKQFLATQDDSISDSDAITKYNEYKLEFRRQQLNEFFVAHKDEEWFKIKYHPEESLKRKEEQIEYLKKRVEVFVELLNKGDIGQICVDTTNTDQLLRLLDTVVIKLEGGSDEDLKVLDQKPIEIKEHVPRAEKVEKPEESVEKKEAGDAADKPEENGKEKDEGSSKEDESKKRKRSHSSSSSSSSSSSDSDDSDSEKGKKDEKEKEKSKTPEPKEPAEDEKMDVKEDGEEDGEKNESMEEKKPETPGEEDVEVKEEKEAPEVVDLVKEEDKPKPLEELHKTSSIFLRNLAPTITKAEVEALCKRYDGFLRVAIADPLVERRWFRRGWVTFKRDVNIKEICWNLNNIRLRDCELGAIVNRDLSRRVRPVNGITAHKTVCKSDIKLCAKIAHSLDEKAGLWKEELEGQKMEEEKHTFGLKSHNPVLKNITDYLIEEASAEEEELLGMSADGGKDSEGEMLDRDLELITVLDKIILYLRIVHSVDFYNHCEYPYEDEMPNRCGIIHARGPAPQNKITQTEIQDYIRNFETKMSQFLASNAEVPADELKKLGAKGMDEEVEKFVSANSQELGKDKWLCPLSGKKFKGPDYIRKHIFNKHAEKVEEVKKEVEYFNNYLKDAKRPQLPEHPSKKDPIPNQSPVGGPGYRPYPPAGPYHGPYPQMMVPRGRGFGRGRGMPAPDYRPVIHYRDLDAPREPDEFI